MGLETSPAAISATVDAPGLGHDEAVGLAQSVRIPTLVIHGDEDAIVNVGRGRELARLCGAQYVELPGGGHEPQSRSPVSTNEIIDGFLAHHYPPSVPEATQMRMARRAATVEPHLRHGRSGSA
jgi:pimeloyl-ACP methyl ester carboxylesterase